MTSPGKLILLFLLLFAVAFAAGYYSYPQPEATGAEGLSLPASKNVQVEPGLGRNMFGIQLRPEARKLWQEVEEHYKRQVREELTSDLGYSYYAGLASVDPDGTPAVKLRDDERPTEERIVHELYHLKLYADGYPVIRIEYPQRWPNEKERSRIRFLISEVYNTIEHWLFYPEMRRMGITPDKSVRSDAELILDDGEDVDDTPGVTRRDTLVLDYFKAALLLNDAELFSRLEEQYNSKRWTEELRTGREMAGIINSSDPSTPEAAVDALMRCLEALDRNNAFEVSTWETEKRGNHTLRRIYIKVTPRSRR